MQDIPHELVPVSTLREEYIVIGPGGSIYGMTTAEDLDAIQIEEPELQIVHRTVLEQQFGPVPDITASVRERMMYSENVARSGLYSRSTSRSQLHEI